MKRPRISERNLNSQLFQALTFRQRSYPSIFIFFLKPIPYGSSYFYDGSLNNLGWYPLMLSTYISPHAVGGRVGQNLFMAHQS